MTTGAKPASLYRVRRVMAEDLLTHALDTLCPDNGGSSGADYSGDYPLALAALRTIRRSGMGRAFTGSLLSVPGWLRLLFLFNAVRYGYLADRVD
jgi:hypothetical protein